MLSYLPETKCSTLWSLMDIRCFTGTITEEEMEMWHEFWEAVLCWLS